jgi:hypothetical protein
MLEEEERDASERQRVYTFFDHGPVVRANGTLARSVSQTGSMHGVSYPAFQMQHCPRKMWRWGQFKDVSSALGTVGDVTSILDSVLESSSPSSPSTAATPWK